MYFFTCLNTIRFEQQQFNSCYHSFTSNSYLLYKSQRDTPYGVGKIIGVKPIEGVLIQKLRKEQNKWKKLNSEPIIVPFQDVLISNFQLTREGKVPQNVQKFIE